MRVHTLNNISFEIWIIYYLILGIMQALWINPSSFPPTSLRIAMIVAVFGPIFLRREIVLLAIPFSMTLRGFLSTPYSFLPDLNSSYDFYIYVLLLSMAIHIKKLNFSLYGKMKPLIAMTLYFAIVDFLSNGEFGNYAVNIFIGLLLVPFLKKEEDFHLLSAALIASSALLAIYYIVMFDEFLEAWGRTGFERSGWTDPNYFAIMFARGFMVAILYLLGFCKSDHLFFNKKILVGSCLFIAAAVFMTASRTGFLCIAFILAIVIFNTKISLRKFLLVILLIITAGVYMYSEGIMDVLMFRLFEQGDMNTGGSRTFIWQKFLRNFDNQDVVNLLFGGGYWYRAELTGGADTHNEFFSIMADYGLIGLLLFISFFFSICLFRRGEFWKQNVAVVFYFLSVIALSPFQSVFILFLIVWIYAFKFNKGGMLTPIDND